jgi:hypothetical protein
MITESREFVAEERHLLIGAAERRFSSKHAATSLVSAPPTQPAQGVERRANAGHVRLRVGAVDVGADPVVLGAHLGLVGLVDRAILETGVLLAFAASAPKAKAAGRAIPIGNALAVRMKAVRQNDAHSLLLRLDEMLMTRLCKGRAGLSAQDAKLGVDGAHVELSVRFLLRAGRGARRGRRRRRHRSRPSTTTRRSSSPRSSTSPRARTTTRRGNLSARMTARRRTTAIRHVFRAASRSVRLPRSRTTLVVQSSSRRRAARPQRRCQSGPRSGCLESSGGGRTRCRTRHRG